MTSSETLPPQGSAMPPGAALVTHGGGDAKVPPSVSARLKAAKPALVIFAVFPGAGHVESWNIDRARYTTLLESFMSSAAP